MESAPMYFVIGSGRSGTTALYQQIAAGLVVSSVPALGGKYPALLGASLAARRMGLSGRALTPSNESVGLFASVGLSAARNRELGRAIEAHDMSKDQQKRLRAVLGKVADANPDGPLLIKSTGHSVRIGALASALPSARFIYIHRDPRAVARSLLKVGFWPDLALWWAQGKTPTELAAEGQPPHVIAATHWAKQVEAARSSLAELAKDRWMSVRYEELVTSPAQVLSAVERFMAPVKQSAAGLRPANFDARFAEQWKTDFTAEQISAIEDAAQPHMTELDYHPLSGTLGS